MIAADIIHLEFAEGLTVHFLRLQADKLVAVQTGFAFKNHLRREPFLLKMLFELFPTDFF